MSYLTEKMSYIRGLAEGLEIDETTKEGKLLLAMVEALSDTADEIAGISELQEEISLQLDEVDEDLDALEGFVYDDEDDFDEYEDKDEFVVECPNCNDTIYLDADLLENCDDKITCPSCGEEIELEFDCDCENCSECEK